MVDTDTTRTLRAPMIAELVKVTLDEVGIAMLASLPPPESADLSGSRKEARAALDRLFGLWIKLVAENAPLPRPPDSGHAEEGEDLRGRLILSVAGYFDFLARRYIWGEGAAHAPAAEFPEAFKIDAFHRFLPRREELATGHRLFEFRLLSHTYFYVHCCLYFARLFRRPPMPRGMAGQFESFAHEGLRALVEHCFAIVGRNEQTAARRLTRGALKVAEMIYADYPSWDAKHPPGPFSAIRLDELALLAKRDESLLRRYGAKSVERVFEHQLALVMQSFGLYVVATRAGRSTVDLVCISSGPDERRTFLIEAKTTKKPYALPKKDARALRDYVDDIRKSLSTLAPLSFVLLISHEPARTIAAKLSQLEVLASVPVRFMSAHQLATIRERIPGPLPLNVFSTAVLTGGGVVSADVTDRVVDSYQAEQRAHQAFVDAMLSARGVTPRTSEWDEHKGTAAEPKPSPP